MHSAFDLDSHPASQAGYVGLATGDVNRRPCFRLSLGRKRCHLAAICHLMVSLGLLSRDLH